MVQQNNPMTFARARMEVLGFGPFKGMSLDEIAENDEGLRYLDNLLNWDGLWNITRTAVETYLEDEKIAQELEALLDG